MDDGVLSVTVVKLYKGLRALIRATRVDRISAVSVSLFILQNTPGKKE